MLKRLTKKSYEITKFEKQMRKLCSSINDVTLKKYILEDFLSKINKSYSKCK